MNNIDGHEDLSEKDENTIESNETQYELALLQKKRMQELVDSPSFLLLRELLEKQIEYRIREMLTMPNGTDDVVRRTYSSGEIAGMKLSLDFPQVLISGAQETIEMWKAREGRE